MATFDATKNFAKVTVSAGYAAGAVTVVLSADHGSRLPQPTTDGEFNLTWWNNSDYGDPTDDPNKEIVRCTARTTDTLTVTRAQEGTSDSIKNISAKVYRMALAITAKVVDDLGDAINATDPTTTEGDTIYRDSSGPARLAIGTAGQALVVNTGATATEWGTAGHAGVDTHTENTAGYLTCGASGAVGAYRTIGDAAFKVSIDGSEHEVDEATVDGSFMSIKRVKNGAGYEEASSAIQYCQTFNSGGLTHIDSLMIPGKPKATGAGIYVTCKIYSLDGSGHPDTELKSVQVLGSTINDSQYYSFYKFAMNIDVDKDTTYGIVMGSSTTSTTYVYRWVRTTDGSFGYKSLKSTNSGVDWADFTTDYEFVFELEGTGTSPLKFSGYTDLKEYSYDVIGVDSITTAWIDAYTFTADGNRVSELYATMRKAGTTTGGEIELALRDNSNTVLDTILIDPADLSTYYGQVGGVLTTPIATTDTDTYKVSVRYTGTPGNGLYYTSGKRLYTVPDYAVDLDDVATLIQNGLNLSTSEEETVEYDTDHFVITSYTDGLTSAVSVLSAPTTGVDISGSSYMNGVTGTTTAGTSDKGKVALLNDDGVIDSRLVDGGFYYGSGIDGKVIISGNTTLTRDMYYSSLTINSGITLTPDGYKIHVAGTLTNEGTIAANGLVGTAGNNASSSTSPGSGGAGAVAVTTSGPLASGLRGRPGGAGGTAYGASGVAGAAGDAASPALIGNGATGGTGGSAGGVGGAGGAGGTGTTETTSFTMGNISSTLTNNTENTESIIYIVKGSSSEAVLSAAAGGGGGGGGSSADSQTAAGGGGGGSGSGAAVLYISAKNIVNTSGAIEAIGGAGGAGGNGWDSTENGGAGGGGAGGAGGTIVLLYETLTGTEPDVSGGAGGVAGWGDGGTAGGTQAGVYLKVKVQFT